MGITLSFLLSLPSLISLSLSLSLSSLSSSYTPLMEGAREGHEEVVKLLVEHDAKVNAQTEETQETALTLASCGGFIDVVQYLIKNGQFELILA